MAEIKNDLISNITHEFKTPIATVSTAIEAIANFNVLDNKEKNQKYLSMSSLQLKKLHQMVEKLLETATLDSEDLILKKDNDKINIGDYTFNYTKQILQITEELISLTHRESELLFHLYEKKNEVLDRTFILKKLWGGDDFFNARSMGIFISKLRKKLVKDKNIQIINVRGFGYKLTI